MNARVRSPGASPAVTASAATRRTSRSGWDSRASPASSFIGPSGWGTSMAEVSSPNSRDQALRPLTAFSVTIRSSGSESRWGR